MNIDEQVSLANYSTMRLGGLASYCVHVTTEDELKQAVEWAEQKDLEVLMIGGGSNIVWRDEGFKGLLIVNRIKQFAASEIEPDKFMVTIGAGEDWDQVVRRCCELGLSGIECLSLIPGTAGATPIQNIGAYGQEISKVLVSLEAYDNQTKTIVGLDNQDCNFSYRHSRFKNERGRFLITRIVLKLTKTTLMPPFYDSLAKYLSDNNITDYSPSSLRAAVIAIRNQKLPDPAVINNCGSFFANPIISNEQFNKLQSENESAIPHWEMPGDMQKIAAGWLIDKAGLKGFRDEKTGMSTWPKQALVLVNEHASSTADLLDFKAQIVEKIQSMFGITLIQEPELLPL